ncbi:hydantoinase/oxoprolinase family protein [Rhodovarius crocodyli]|uniref:Hydantoinase/oxoprolinase family protein n=1 Tax=Rhodovarius crocodyli TaxID=1979269 RepID=A0A437MEC3_9PROT|nr:hydantoinase/oxoprolinase family protein [Rhodovarius crocodyli]RVT96023.1 hydantoinase/oxoprolinase family protein [Rhodovarius crocodyli]
MSKWRIGVDVGGTFTDVVGVGPDGQARLAKAASTPHDQSEGVIQGLRNLAEAAGLTLEALLAGTERIVHGTTVATNALLERKGAKVAMLTTEGHRDVIEMREGLKPERYNLRLAPPEPLVPRSRRFGVKERLRADGAVETGLDEASLAAAIEAARGAEAVAICFLHAWRDPAHEQAAAEAVRAALPGVFVTTSAEVLPEIKEFERFSTTAVNAYVGPPVSRYLGRLAEGLKKVGYAGPVFVILSHGGVTPIAEAARLAAGTALSGPAGGVAAAVALAREGMAGDLVTFDMGGTSTDIALVAGGVAKLGRGREVAGERIALESLDIITLGAGGGSIAHVGAGGTLQVGPESAGARPGPACYGRGGTLPTVTDANLLLGHLDPGSFLGGAQRLDVEASEAAMARLAERLGISMREAAWGVYRLVNARMADGVRVATVRRGVDPRGATLLSFGGAAGLHASAVARDLGMARYAVPLFAAGLSAWGMLRTDLRFEVTRSVNANPDASLAATFAAQEEAARARMAEWFDGEITATRSADMRYGEQVFEIGVKLDGVDWQGAAMPDAVRQAFHDQHEALFTYSLPQDEVVLVNARVAALGRLTGDAGRYVAPPMLAAEPRQVWRDGGFAEWPVYRFGDLADGATIQGPAILESPTTTILVQAGDTATMDARGWLMAEID